MTVLLTVYQMSSLLGRQNVAISPLAYCRMAPGGRLALTWPYMRLCHRMLRTSGGRTLRNLPYSLLYTQLVKKTRTVGNQF